MSLEDYNLQKCCSPGCSGNMVTTAHRENVITVWCDEPGCQYWVDPNVWVGCAYVTKALLERRDARSS